MPWLLSDEFKEQVESTVRKVLSEYQNLGEKRPRWFNRKRHRGANVYMIEFTISVVESSTRRAYSAIHAVLSGQTIQQMPGQEPIGSGHVWIYDPPGCYINEPEATLLGRKGYAAYFQPIIPDEYGELVEPRWQVFSLCCPNAACGVDTQ